ncbi:MAG: hypothetical protein CMC82_02585 [Flavobacteriaceae bacterium]|nr:hypothetical protein [Flavobacteriaceae bacterium]
MNKSEDIKELALALTKAQASMGGAKKDGSNPFFDSKFADLNSIIKVIKPAFAKNGLAYCQFPVTVEDRIGVETVITHSSGQFISNEFTMKVPKADPQSAGGVISYCRRYALQAVCGIPAVDSDAEEYMEGVRKTPLEEALETPWRGKIKHTGKTLGKIMKEDPDYMVSIIKENYEVLQKKDPEMLKLVELVVSDYQANGNQDFPEAA